MAGGAIFDRALVLGPEGKPGSQTKNAASRDRDEVQDFCRRACMSYRIRPPGNNLEPAATMRQPRIGGIIVTHFSYGVPIHLDELPPPVA